MAPGSPRDDDTVLPFASERERHRSINARAHDWWGLFAAPLDVARMMRGRDRPAPRAHADRSDYRQTPFEVLGNEQTIKLRIPFARISGWQPSANRKQVAPRSVDPQQKHKTPLAGSEGEPWEAGSGGPVIDSKNPNAVGGGSLKRMKRVQASKREDREKVISRSLSRNKGPDWDRQRVVWTPDEVIHHYFVVLVL